MPWMSWLLVASLPIVLAACAHSREPGNSVVFALPGPADSLDGVVSGPTPSMASVWKAGGCCPR